MPQNNAPLWDRRAPETEARGLWTVKRCPTKGRLVIQIWSHDLVATPTHYVANRTRPCTGTTCEVCNAGTRPRWHYYLAGMDTRTKERTILELTPNAAEVLIRNFDERRSLKGCYVALERATPKPNGRIIARVGPPQPNDVETPKAPDVRPIMERVWEVTGSNVTPTRDDLIKILRPTGTDGAPPNGNRDTTID